MRIHPSPMNPATVSWSRVRRSSVEHPVSGRRAPTDRSTAVGDVIRSRIVPKASADSPSRRGNSLRLVGSAQSGDKRCVGRGETVACDGRSAPPPVPPNDRWTCTNIEMHRRQTLSDEVNDRQVGWIWSADRVGGHRSGMDACGRRRRYAAASRPNDRRIKTAVIAIDISDGGYARRLSLWREHPVERGHPTAGGIRS